MQPTGATPCVCAYTSLLRVNMIVPSPYFLLSLVFININNFLKKNLNQVQVDIHCIYLKHKLTMYSVKSK